MPIGCDIIEIERIKNSIDKFGDKFLHKILSSTEIKLYHNKSSRIDFIAGRFAAKEAISKSLGTGITDDTFFTDIEILPDELGRPVVYINGIKRDDISVSISHSRDSAIAVALINEG